MSGQHASFILIVSRKYVCVCVQFQFNKSDSDSDSDLLGSTPGSGGMYKYSNTVLEYHFVALEIYKYYTFLRHNIYLITINEHSTAFPVNFFEARYWH